jgi:hypothetical protein
MFEHLFRNFLDLRWGKEGANVCGKGCIVAAAGEFVLREAAIWVDGVLRGVGDCCMVGGDSGAQAHTDVHLYVVRPR